MKSLTAAIMTAAAMLPALASAQIKTIPGEAITVTATVEALDHHTRLMTLKAADGTLTTLSVPDGVRRLDEIKVGDTISAKYVEHMILRLMKPGEDPVNSVTGSVAPGAGAKPSATATVQRSITATITAIDSAIPSITLVGPEKRTYTSKVADAEALKQLKIGDRLDITWSAAVLIAVEPAKPK